jgi:hypothetical protein
MAGAPALTKITIFVAGYPREYLPAIEEGRVALFGDHKPTDTLVGGGGTVPARLPDRGGRDRGHRRLTLLETGRPLSYGAPNLSLTRFRHAAPGMIPGSRAPDRLRHVMSGRFAHEEGSNG